MEKYTMYVNRKKQRKAIYRFNAIPIKLRTVFFTELEQIISQFVWKYKKTSNSQSNLDKEEWNWRNQPAWLQALLQATVIKTVWYWHKDRNIDQWNKIESPEINPRTYGHFIFDKEARIYNGLKTISLTSGSGKTGQPLVKEFEHFLTPYIKINSKWIKDLNVRPETIKVLEENIGKILSDINHSRIPYDPPPRVMEIKAKINKWDLIKLKSFCTMKDTISKVKRQT